MVTDKINPNDELIRRLLRWIENKYAEKIANTVSAYMFTDQIIAQAEKFISTLDEQNKKRLNAKKIIDERNTFTRPKGFYFLFQIVDLAIERRKRNKLKVA